MQSYSKAMRQGISNLKSEHFSTHIPEGRPTEIKENKSKTIFMDLLSITFIKI